jgi:hypothetical protein
MNVIVGKDIERVVADSYRGSNVRIDVWVRDKKTKLLERYRIETCDFTEIMQSVPLIGVQTKQGNQKYSRLKAIPS